MGSRSAQSDMRPTILGGVICVPSVLKTIDEYPIQIAGHTIVVSHGSGNETWSISSTWQYLARFSSLPLWIPSAAIFQYASIASGDIGVLPAGGKITVFINNRVF